MKNILNEIKIALIGGICFTSLVTSIIVLQKVIDAL